MRIGVTNSKQAAMLLTVNTLSANREWVRVADVRSELLDMTGHQIGVGLKYMQKNDLLEMHQQREADSVTNKLKMVRYYRLTNEGRKEVRALLRMRKQVETA